MGVGVWKVDIAFKLAPVETTGPSGARVQTIHATASEFLHWVVTNAVEWPASEEDEVRPLRVKAEALSRPRPFVRVWNAATRSWRLRSPGFSAQRRATASDAAEMAAAEPVVSQALIDDFRRLFPNLEVTEADDWIGLTSEDPAQYVIIVPEHRTGLVVYSISRESCERLSGVAHSFATQIGASVIERTEKLYTPEDVTFLPYIGLLRLYQSNWPVTSNDNANRDLAAAVEKITTGSPEDSVRESGSALEQLLSEIFEQCFREKAPARPLGVELRELGTKALEIAGDRGTKASEFDPRPIHEELGRHIESASDPAIKAGLIASQTLATHTKDAKDRLAKVERAVEISRPRSHPLFSDEIAGNIERAIDLRNAAAHRGSRRITRFEAAVTARGVVNLSSWWNRRHEMVTDWDAAVQEVVAGILKAGPSIRLGSL